MKFDFDTPIDIRGSHASKWDFMRRACNVSADDAIAMWVADMDFPAPPAVRDAVRRVAEHGFLGYYGLTTGWREAQCDWLATRHGWRPDPDWLNPVPGIMFGLALALQRFSDPGDSVVIFTPVYHEFATTITANDRVVHEQPLVEEQGRYRMNLDALAREIPKNARIVVLCSPHNPSGRVWTAEELRELASFCIERNLLLISDEIHCDLVYSGARHVPIAVAAPEISDRLITLVGATKTFNIAGAKTGAMIISNSQVKGAIDAALRASSLGTPNRFGVAATEAALREGAPWLAELLPYLEANRDRFAETMARIVPGARPMHLEATFLAWVNFSETELPPEQVLDRIGGKARIGVYPGYKFGPGGENFIRFNIATHRARIDEALGRLEEAFSDLR